MNNLDLAPDPQHLTNSKKVAWRKSSSLECLLLALPNMASLYLYLNICVGSKSAYILMLNYVKEKKNNVSSTDEEYDIMRNVYLIFL